MMLSHDEACRVGAYLRSELLDRMQILDCPDADALGWGDLVQMMLRKARVVVAERADDGDFVAGPLDETCGGNQ